MDDKEAVPINIGNINDGAMIEAFDIELQKALANIADINTPATASRTITLELVLKPHSDRITIETVVACKTKLAAIEKHKSKVFLGASDEGGYVAFDRDPRQMPLWSVPKPEKSKTIIFDASGAQK